jgi:hypothetical protein
MFCLRLPYAVLPRSLRQNYCLLSELCLFDTNDVVKKAGDSQEYRWRPTANSEIVVYTNYILEILDIEHNIGIMQWILNSSS